jgi:cell division protein FtsB
LSKVAITYWGNNNTVSLPKLNARSKTRARMKFNRETATPQWFIFAVVVSITFMLCLTINFRAFSELSAEIEQNQKLNAEVEQLSNQNLAIQEEIHNIKTDPKMIENEARKLGMGRLDEKIFVPAN